MKQQIIIITAKTFQIITGILAFIMVAAMNLALPILIIWWLIRHW